MLKLRYRILAAFVDPIVVSVCMCLCVFVCVFATGPMGEIITSVGLGFELLTESDIKINFWNSCAEHCLHSPHCGHINHNSTLPTKPPAVCVCVCVCVTHLWRRCKQCPRKVTAKSSHFINHCCQFDPHYPLSFPLSLSFSIHLFFFSPQTAFCI